MSQQSSGVLCVLTAAVERVDPGIGLGVGVACPLFPGEVVFELFEVPVEVFVVVFVEVPVDFCVMRFVKN